MKSCKTVFFLIFFLFLGAVIASCHKKPPTPTKDTAYLTPPPQATLLAYRSDQPIESTLEAAIAARRALDRSA